MTSRRWRGRRLTVGVAVGAALLLVGAVVVWVAHPLTAGRAPSTRGPAPPAAGGYFSTLPPGADLPSGEECARRVHRSAWEPRPQNAASGQIPAAVRVPSDSTFQPEFFATLAPRIDGNFVGTTDETIQWASCKWGFADDLTRAQAFIESKWDARAKGDFTSDLTLCPQPERRGRTCPQSFGLLQIKARYHPGSYPLSLTAMAFGLDYGLAMQRGCYEGMQYVGDGGYGPGDLWGCLGLWFSGRWHDQAAQARVRVVQEVLGAKPWLTWLSVRATGAPRQPDRAAGGGSVVPGRVRRDRASADRASAARRVQWTRSW